MTRTVKALAIAGVLTATAAGGAWIGRVLAPTAAESHAADDGHRDTEAKDDHAPHATVREANGSETSEATEPYAATQPPGNPGGPSPEAEQHVESESDAAILARVEQLIRDGSCRSAVAQLERINVATTTAALHRVWFLKGFCYEGLGELPEARAAYEQATSAADSPLAARQARLAHARVLHLNRQDELVSQALYRELLTLGGGEWDIWDADTIHLLAASLSQQISAAGEAIDPFDDAALLTSRARLDARRSLEPPTPASPVSESAVAEDSLRVMQRFGDEPQQVHLEWRATQITIADALFALRELLEQPIHWPASVERQLAGRRTSINVRNLELSLTLDALLAPLGLTWRATPGRIDVVPLHELPPEEAESDRQARAERALNCALSKSPDHPWTPNTCNSLARLKAAAGQPDVALALYAQSRDLSRGRHAVEADLNEGKLSLTQRDRTRAMQALFRCIDSVDAHPLKLVAYAYLGRMQLEEGSTHAAIATLQRAVALAENTEHNALLTLQLASALLLDGNPGGANSVLANRRELFDEPDLKAAAAFVAAYARFQVATDDDRREREAANIIQSLTQVHPAKLFGGHWWCLTAQAYAELGMIPDAERIAQESLIAAPPFPLRDRLMQSLLSAQLIRQPTAELEASASAMLADTDRGLGPESRLEAARTEFRRGLDDAALRRARSLVEDVAAPQGVRAAALRLLGHIYQHRADHVAAIQCFSGVLPGSALPALELESPGSPPAAGGGH